MHELLRKVLELSLPARDFAIFGSGPLLAHGVIEQANDIDIICRGEAWAAAQELGELLYLDQYDVQVVSIENGLITLGTSWGIGDFDVNTLIDSAEMIDGLPFVRLQHVIEYKQVAKRRKDIEHLALLKSRGFLPES